MINVPLYKIKIIHPAGRIYPIVHFMIYSVMPIGDKFKVGNIIIEVTAFDIFRGRIYGSGKIIEELSEA